METKYFKEDIKFIEVKWQLIWEDEDDEHESNNEGENLCGW